MPEDEYEEFAYVRSLVKEELEEAEAHFRERYPDGTTFLPQKDDYAYLDVLEARMVRKISDGRGRYPGWEDFDVAGFASVARMSLMTRFRRAKRDFESMPNWNLMVEAVLEAGKEADADGKGLPASADGDPEGVRRPKKPVLRTVEGGNPEA